MFVVEAVALLASNSPEGQVHLGGLGQYLKRMDPGFSPSNYGHSGLLSMLRTYDLLSLKQAEGGHHTVSLAPSTARETVSDTAPSDASSDQQRTGSSSIQEP